jgi:hypothetical protein
MKLSKKEKKLIKKHRNRPIWDIYIPLNREELDRIIGSLEVQENGAADEADPQLADDYATLKLKLAEYREKL